MLLWGPMDQLIGGILAIVLGVCYLGTALLILAGLLVTITRVVLRR